MLFLRLDFARDFEGELGCVGKGSRRLRLACLIATCAALACAWLVPRIA